MECADDVLKGMREGRGKVERASTAWRNSPMSSFTRRTEQNFLPTLNGRKSSCEKTAVFVDWLCNGHGVIFTGYAASGWLSFLV